MGANLTVSGDYATKEKPLVTVGGSGDEKDYNLLLTRPTYMPESVNGYDILAYGPSNTPVSYTHLTLGNKAKNNTEADKPTVKSYSTLVPATTIPTGSDISDFIPASWQQ